MKKSAARRTPGLGWTVVLSVVCALYLYPVVLVLLNSFKTESAISTNTAFLLPTPETFAGLANYVDAIASKGFLRSLGYSLIITLSSVALICCCCSMCAWYNHPRA